LMGDEIYKKNQYYHLEYLQVHLGTHSIPTATIKLRINNEEAVQESATGDGPVDAIFNAIDRKLEKAALS